LIETLLSPRESPSTINSMFEYDGDVEYGRDVDLEVPTTAKSYVGKYNRKWMATHVRLPHV
jgi:hypothetical protein